MLKFWQSLSITKKIYVLIGISVLILAIELFALGFSVDSLSAIRLYMQGESNWSKAQKRAVNMLYLFVLTKDRKYFDEYSSTIKVITSTKQAKQLLNETDYNHNEVVKLLLIGGFDPSDIPQLIKFYRNYSKTTLAEPVIKHWETGEALVGEIEQIAEIIHNDLTKNFNFENSSQLSLINQISILDQKLTIEENLFSSELQDIAKNTEQRFYLILYIVLIISILRILIVILFGSSTKDWLNHYVTVATQVTSGDLTKSLNTSTDDEFGKAAKALNTMISSLRSQTIERLSAEHASLSKNIFLANMSHEIRTPLNSILGFSEILRDQNLSDIERETYANIIKRTGASLLSIIQDILDIARIEAEQISIEFSVFSLDQLIIDLKELLNLKASEKGVELRIEKLGNIEVYIRSDLTRVRQILLNVLGNAIKFTDQGYVRMQYWVDGSQLVFTIKDTGVGIAPDQLSNLFRPFSQGDSSVSKRFGGTGLGLMISKRLAQLLGGDVQFIDSQVAVGSTFEVRIRYEPETNQLNFPTLPLHPSGDLKQMPDSVLTNKNVLVVEDSADNQILIQAHLNRYGAKVDTANDGKEGLEKCLIKNYDLIILDMQMPIMDGYTAARKIRKNGFKTPILALTGYAMRDDEEKCLTAGCNAYLAKPFNREVFIRTVIHMLTKPIKPNETETRNQTGGNHAT